MPSAAEQVARQFGIPSEEFNAAAQTRAINTTTHDPMVEHVHRIVTNRRLRREELALATRLDEAHAIIKKIAKETGVPHVSLLNTLADKALAEQAEDSDAADEGDGDIENDEPDADNMRSVQDMTTASPAPQPSPVDKSPDTGSPRFLARHAQSTAKVPGGGNLLLNVSQSEFNRARIGHA